MIHGISKGDSLGFYYLDPTKSKKILSKGIVDEVFGYSCKVTLTNKLPMIQKEDYSLFSAKCIYQVLEGQQLKLALEVSDKESIKIIRNELKDITNIRVVDPTKDAPNYYLKEDDQKKIRIEIPFSGNPFKEMKPLSMSNSEDVAKLIDFLKQALRIDYFTNLELSDERIDVTVKLNQMNDSLLTAKMKDIRSRNPNYNNVTNVRGFNMEVVNNSSDLIYLHAVYIGNNKIISELTLSKDGKDKFVKLYPNVSKKAKDFESIITFCSPDVDCGVDRIYFFASREKMDFSAVEKSNNLLAALIDNNVQNKAENNLNIDPRIIYIKKADSSTKCNVD
jgi:hypothetical protein